MKNNEIKWADVVAIVGTRSASKFVAAVTVELAVRHGVVVEVSLPMPTSSGRELSDGFEWGYSGTGPHALAVALLALFANVSAAGAEEVLRAKYGGDAFRFRDVFVAKLPRDGGFRIERAELARAVCDYKVLAPARLFVVDGVRYTLGEMLDANADDDETRAWCIAAQPGESTGYALHEERIECVAVFS